MSSEASSCSICFEFCCESNAVSLSQCGHEFCSDCLESWFVQQEQSMPIGHLTCPDCREPVSPEDAKTVLGRSPRDRSQSHTREELAHDDNDSDDESDTMDEFTYTYLREQGAKQCPDCGVWIVLEEGCDNVMCRCGCRFCFCCGEKGTCGGGTFYNNFADQEEVREYFWSPDEGESVAGEVTPLFEGGSGSPWWFVEEEVEPMERLSPLFEDDWNVEGNIEMAPEGIEEFLKELGAFFPDPDLENYEYSRLLFPVANQSLVEGIALEELLRPAPRLSSCRV